MNYYQITLEEMLEPEKIWTAKAEPAPERGLIDYLCPICGATVGIYSTGAIHEEGWLFKRNPCQHGHKVRIKPEGATP